jgi:uncharacterized protein YcaQ
MASRVPRLDARDARRLLLGAQGLLDDPARRASPAVVRRLVERMGFVQVDSIHVVARAHHLTLHARLDGYRPTHWRALLERRRDLFEHWTHDASAIPTAFFVPWRHRCRRLERRASVSKWVRRRLGRGWRSRLERVKERLARDGPLREALERLAATVGASDVVLAPPRPRAPQAVSSARSASRSRA